MSRSKLYDAALKLAKEIYPDYSKQIVASLAKEINGVSRSILTSRNVGDREMLIEKYLRQYGLPEKTGYPAIGRQETDRILLGTRRHRIGRVGGAQLMRSSLYGMRRGLTFRPHLHGPYITVRSPMHKVAMSRHVRATETLWRHAIEIAYRRRVKRASSRAGKRAKRLKR